MIKELEVEIKGHRTNIDYLRNLGYEMEYRKPTHIKILDLMSGSTAIITSICDNCLDEKLSEFRFYYEYTNGLKSNYYCKKCNKIKRKETCLQKWGVENPMQSQEVREKLKSTLLENWGVDHYSKTDEYKEKYRQTCLDKWGVENTFQSEIHKEKIKSTNLEKLGVEYPQQNGEIKKKTTQSMLKNWGVERYSQTPNFKEDIKSTSQSKWQVDNYSQTEEFKIRCKNTSLKKWGVDHYSHLDTFKKSIKEGRENLSKLKYDNLIGENYNVINYEDSTFKIIHNVCNREFQIHRNVLYNRINLDICICTKCLDVNLRQSNMELEMIEFLNSFNMSYNIKDRKILNGKEIDIYLPDKNLAIEMNGVYWHSEIYLGKKYHVDKTLKCRESGIDLLHIWEDDWKYKRNIIKSIIKNKIGISGERIFARKCLVKTVKSSDAIEFLDRNHIQGSSPSQFKLGLYFGEELVSLMTFGWRWTNSKKEFELIRFCNKLNTNVIGAASKLFSHFLKSNPDISEIISYSDISLFSGELYGKLGFIKNRISEPNYFWVVDGVRKHRFNFNKKRLVKLGFDPNLSESQIMHNRGYYRIYSCGQEKWIFRIKL